MTAPTPVRGLPTGARACISISWWMALFPGPCIFATVPGINPPGDVLRSHSDPEIRNF